MSDGNTAYGATDPDIASGGTSAGGASSAVDTAKQTLGTAKDEASNVASTAAENAAGIASTAKEEAASVASEATSQLGDLFHEARGQLSDQAAQQQGRIASGLRAVGDELGSMSRNAEGGGVATDLVQQASERLSAAGSWLADRDPASVLEEVKAFARRRPVVFIAAAALAGIVVGRLTRALASGGASGGGSSTRSSGDRSVPPVPITPPAVAAATDLGGAPTPSSTTGLGASTAPTAGPAVAEDEVPPFVAVGDGPEDSPLYSESAARYRAGADEVGTEVPDDRRDTL
jgi:hypothetical protein